MADIGTIVSLVASGTGSLLSATEIGKNLKEVFRRPEVDLTASKQLVLDLLDELLDAKRAHMQIEEAVMELQRELKDRDQFEAELARYALTDTGRGALVLSLKSDDPKGEPSHSICPGCAGKRKKSILQPAPDNRNFLVCPSCDTRFLRHNPDGSGIMVAPGRSTRDWSDF
jgi:hypothetical protein